MRPSKRHSRGATPPAIPATWGEAVERCPFRSFIGIGSGDASEMARRMQHTFAALGGRASPVDEALLTEMAASIHAGGTVLVISDRATLRDQAKREILAKVHDAAGSA